MSIWQSPYRPPPIRSRAVIRPHRSAAAGDVAGEAPQPISPPDIIPLQRGYWTTYGKQTMACVLGLLLSLLFVWGYWPDPYEPEDSSASVYTWLAGIMALVLLCIPFFFFARWRRMEKIFGAEMYSSTEGEAKPEPGAGADEDLSSEELLRRHPNRGKLLDGTQVGLAATLLICAAVAQGVVGSLLLFVESPSSHVVSPLLWRAFAVGLVAQAVVNLVLVAGIMRHAVSAPRLAFYLSVGGLLFSLITLSPLAIAACATGTALMWRMHRAFQMMLARVAEPEKQDPLEAYYHNLLQLLVWVMRADGHCDRREVAKIKTTCDSMNMSAWERDMVIASANLYDRGDLRDAAARYLVAAEAASIADPGHSLMVVAAAVAGADGVIVKEEADAMRDLGKAVRLAPDHVDQLLLQQQLHLEALDAKRAHELLHLDEGATPAQVETAHLALATDLNKSRYGHIGTTLADQVHQRHAILDRARDLLLKEAKA